MRECLRCGLPCGEAIFCEQCQASLLSRSRQGYASLPLQPSWSCTEVMEGEASSICDQPTALQIALPVRGTGTRQGVPQTARTSQLPAERAVKLDKLSKSRQREITLRRLRFWFVVLTLLAVLALSADSVLVSFFMARHHSASQQAQQSSPLLTIAPAIAYSGQVAQLHLTHFSAYTQVLISRDIEDQVRLNQPSTVVRVDAVGSANVQVFIEDSWGAGEHFIQAEELPDHYIASVALQVVSTDGASPAHLQLSQTTLNVGADLQGADALRTITLQNTGDGVISWSASSNQHWLSLTPEEGSFSDSQHIVIGVDRATMQPGSYTGMITFIPTTGKIQTLEVDMSVVRLPMNPGPVLSITPPTLAFVSTDGDNIPESSVITLANPGSAPLYWSISGIAPTVSPNHVPISGVDMSWFHIAPLSGLLRPGADTSIRVQVDSQKLLPGVYSGLVLFTAGQNALNSPQPLAVSLDVQPRCGISTNEGNITFSAFARQPVSTTQTVALQATSDCLGALSWSALSSLTWLAITPGSGTVQAHRQTLITFSFNTHDLPVGYYSGFVVFLTPRRTQTIAVQLNILAGSSSLTTAVAAKHAQGTVSSQSEESSTATSATSAANTANTTNTNNGNSQQGSAPSGTALAQSSGNGPPNPALGLSPSTLTFSVTQGQTSPPGQAVTIANTGGATLYWTAREDSADTNWLQVNTSTGILSAGQSQAVILTVDAASLPSGAEHANVYIVGTDSTGKEVMGSPQVISVTLNILQPCTLVVSPDQLTFSGVLQSHLTAQNLTIASTGNCAFPLSWTASVDVQSHSWLIPSMTLGSDNGGGSVVPVQVNASGILLGVYHGQITLSATDSSGNAVQNSPLVVPVSLSIILG